MQDEIIITLVKIIWQQHQIVRSPVHTTSVLHNEKVLVADGNQNDIALHSTELY